MNSFRKLYRLLKESFFWGEPTKSKVYIFYEESVANVISENVLGDIEHSILDVRNPPYPIDARISIRLFLHLCLNALRLFKKNGFLHIARETLINLDEHYYYVLLKSNKALVAITLIDSSVLFHSLALKCPNIKFIAIQNGIRSVEWAIDLEKELKRRNDKAIVNSGYFFGQQTIDLLNNHNVKVIEPHILGSFKLGVYQKVHVPKIVEYDICLISQWRHDFFEVYEEPKRQERMKAREEAIVQLNSYLKQYIGETGSTICIAVRYKNQDEIDFYNEAFDGRATLFLQDSSPYISYAALESADVCVGLYSTLLYEAMALGQKTLIGCLLVGADPPRQGFEPPWHGLWSIKNPSYEQYRDRLSEIREMTNQEYFEIAHEFSDYMLIHDRSNPVHSEVRNIVRSHLNKNSLTKALN
jgi:surface carbohydrate biosynthesis protein